MEEKILFEEAMQVLPDTLILPEQVNETDEMADPTAALVARYLFDESQSSPFPDLGRLTSNQQSSTVSAQASSKVLSSV